MKYTFDNTNLEIEIHTTDFANFDELITEIKELEENISSFYSLVEISVKITPQKSTSELEKKIEDLQIQISQLQLQKWSELPNRSNFPNQFDVYCETKTDNIGRP
jgi:chaperonin cofactor prefoldin